MPVGYLLYFNETMLYKLQRCKNEKVGFDFGDISGTAQSIYNECDKSIPLITETLVINGNFEDVKLEQELRKCLKDKIIEISQLFMKKIRNFEQSLNQLENTSFLLYKSLFFCNDDNDDSWCDIRLYDDISLGKLMLEKQITTQMYNILKDTINAKQGGYVF